MSWRVAHSLEVLRAEINAAAPNRSTDSDGSIGDQAHSSRTSDHNPNAAGVVRARDFTHDPPGGLDGNKLAAHLEAMIRAGRHPALGSGAYVIWNWRILSRDRLDEGWRPYTGSNGHTKHLHLSVATAAAGYDNTSPWGWPPTTEEDDMPFTEKELRKIIREEAEKAVDAVLSVDMNAIEPKGDAKFRGLTLRAVIKRIATATGAV